MQPIKGAKYMQNIDDITIISHLILDIVDIDHIINQSCLRSNTIRFVLFGGYIVGSRMPRPIIFNDNYAAMREVLHWCVINDDINNFMTLFGVLITWYSDKCAEKIIDITGDLPNGE